MQSLFCYRISKDANLAYDIETGEPAECYVSFSIKDNNDNVIDISEDMYHKKHAQLIKPLAKESGLQEDWFEPISIEEYEESQEDD